MIRANAFCDRSWACPAAVIRRMFVSISVSSLTLSRDNYPACPIGRVLPLSVEPEVFVAVAVVDAVDHHGHPLHLRMTAVAWRG